MQKKYVQEWEFQKKIIKDVYLKIIFSNLSLKNKVDGQKNWKKFFL
jgi:hypothetical protein